MIKKKIQTISIACFMLLAAFAIASNTATAALPCTIRGYVYDNEVIIEPDEIILTIDGQDITSTKIWSSGYYEIMDNLPVGKTGTFKVTIGGSTWQAAENITITSEYNYRLNLTIDTTKDPINGDNGEDEENGDTGDDEDDENGETGDTSGNGGGSFIPTNEPPVANAGGPYFGFLGETIAFDGSESYAKDDKTIVGYRWDFNNDGTYDTDWFNIPSAEHVYTSVGEYTVKLQVKDDDDLTATNTTTVTILAGNYPPTIPVVTGETDGSKNINYTYTAVSTDPDNDTIQYVFKWGDETNTTTGFLPNATIATVNHSWDNPGRYIVNVTAIDYHNDTSLTHRLIVLIDAVNVGDIGYLTDDDGDGTYDTYHSNDGTIQTTVEQRDEEYLLDTTGDDEYDHISRYNEETGEWELIKYEPPVTEPKEEDNTLLYIGAVLLVIILLTLFFLATRKKDKGKDKGKKGKSKK